MTEDFQNRFSGLGRLYGEGSLSKLNAAHVAVIGIGGVGSWAAEALARSGIGKLTLIDLDDICITNTNRQLHALNGNFGKPKVGAIAERLKLINPEIEVVCEEEFFTPATADRLLDHDYDSVIDAIDSIKHKAFLIGTCHKREIPLVVGGGAGGKRNPAMVRTNDLAFATNDRLLRQVRRLLRADYEFPHEEANAPFGIRSVYSVENAVFPWSDGSVREMPEPGSSLALNCDSGFGTASFVTGAFGFAAAAEAVNLAISRVK